ncbi:lycopene cyclase family protein [Winogradskyella sp. PE311]|uniref:lycopene cyclase family protein n=1 Tax=Winogradskyella sp. PE311 TaxID=3366943 RepID=UPI0039810E4A
MNKFDYIILGAGASGLMLAYRMSKSTFFDNKKILIIDKVRDKGNDRTWCYWEKGEDEWEELLVKRWSKIFFGSKNYSEEIEITPYTYKMIRSEQFYSSLWKSINTKSNISFLQDEVDNYTELKEGVQVITKKGNYFGFKVFNSLLKPSVYESQKKYPTLQQHFVGWFVKTKDYSFNDSIATFMDFTVAQNGNTRFMYVLPINKSTALFEYTLFSKDFLEAKEYEKAITDYLKEKGIVEYEIIEKERGAIPMTSFKFSELNSNHILNIGTAGGWTKASTGYTFRNTTKKTKELVQFLNTENDLTKFHKKSKFWFYDLLFLDVLAKSNQEGSALFASMFSKGNVTTIFKFLDEESNLIEDLKIILSVPPKRFIQALFRRLF